MSGQQDLNGAGAPFNSAFQDPVFEPSSEFNFEEEPHQMMMPGEFNPQGDFALQ